MTITKQLAFLCSLFLLLNVASPSLVLLRSNGELSTVVITLENETGKDIEDLKDLNEFDVDKTAFQKVNLTLNRESMTFVFCNKPLSETPLENTSPPPELL